MPSPSFLSWTCSSLIYPPLTRRLCSLEVLVAQFSWCFSQVVVLHSFFFISWCHGLFPPLFTAATDLAVILPDSLHSFVLHLSPPTCVLSKLSPWWRPALRQHEKERSLKQLRGKVSRSKERGDDENKSFLSLVLPPCSLGSHSLGIFFPLYCSQDLSRLTSRICRSIL